MKNESKVSAPLTVSSSPKTCLQDPHQSLAVPKGRKAPRFVSHLLIHLFLLRWTRETLMKWEETLGTSGE